MLTLFPCSALPEMSHSEHERGVVLCELPCQSPLFSEQEKTVRKILRGQLKGFSHHRHRLFYFLTQRIELKRPRLTDISMSNVYSLY